MQNNLLSIFNAITPDNIKGIPVIEDSIRIFIELLNEKSIISKDIMNVLSERTTDVIASELSKIYLYDYYSMINNVKNNKTIINKFEKWNSALSTDLYPISLPVIGNGLFINYFSIGEPGAVLTVDSGESQSEGTVEFNTFPFATKLAQLEQNILQHKADNYRVNRLFKESKGLKKGIQFIYDILNEHLVNIDERLELEFSETGNPFELVIKGSVDKDIYAESVAYLSHPLGFVYEYTYVSELKFQDNYALSVNYNIKQLEVRCLSGNVDPYTQKVTNIYERENYLRITFADNSYLLQENDIVRYYDKNDFLIKMYSSANHCSIFVDYEIIYNTALTDEVIFNEKLSLGSDTMKTMTDEVHYTETIEMKRNFIIGISTIGTELISDDSDVFENKMQDTQEYFNEYDVVDSINIDISEVLNYVGTTTFKNNYVIGDVVVGEEVISNDSEVFENRLQDNVLVNNSNSGDEIYSINSIVDDFYIEII